MPTTLPQLNVATYAPQLVWLAISFAVLYLLMSRIALPRISDVLEERRKRREDNLARAEELEKEAEGVSQAYETQLATSRSDAHARIAAAGEAAKEHAEAEIARLDAELREKIQSAEAAIAEARQSALADAAAIAAEAARLAAEKVAGLSVDEAAARAAADEARKARA